VEAKSERPQPVVPYQQAVNKITRLNNHRHSAIVFQKTFAYSLSAGCQTIHPDQWGSFINLVIDQAKRYHGTNWDKVCIPYVLITQP
jgi:hypothetical protein